jgi:hypothetical protein
MYAMLATGLGDTERTTHHYYDRFYLTAYIKIGQVLYFNMRLVSNHRSCTGCVHEVAAPLLVLDLTVWV